MRWVLRSIAVLVLLAALAIGAIAFVPAERIAAIAAARVSEALGREVRIAGSVRPTLWPVLGARVGDIALADAAWSDEGPMLTATSAEIGVDARALFEGRIAVRRVEIAGAALRLHRAADGRANWAFGTAPGGAAAAPGAPPPAFSFDEVILRDATLTWVDEAAGQRRVLTGVNLTATLPDPAGPLGLDLAASVEGVAVRLEAVLGDVAAALAGRPGPLTLSAETGAPDAPGNIVRFDGRAGYGPLAAEGALDLRLDDPDALVRLAALPDPGLPAALAGGGALSGQVTLTPEGSVHLRGGRLRAGPLALDAEADLTTAGARPRLVATLAAGTLDLRPFLVSDTPAQAGTGGWSRAPIDASGLGALDAQVAFRADTVETGTVTLSAVDLTTTLDAARAVTDIRSAGLYGGAISGQVVVNARDGLSVRADLRAAGLALRPALAAFAGFDRLTGTGAGALNVLASGGSLDALVRSADGSGRIDLTAGEILGLDLAGMLRTLDMSYMGEGSKTIFDAIRGSFTIAGGVLANDDLVLDAPLVRATGRGRVDLGARTLDYRVTPAALTGADGTGGVRVPLTISGPWSAPRFGLDLEELAEERLRVERDALEARARDALAREAESRGIVRQEGESLGDAARRSLEDAARGRVEGEVGRALQGLFGGN